MNQHRMRTGPESCSGEMNAHAVLVWGAAGCRGTSLLVRAVGKRTNLRLVPWVMNAGMAS